MREDDDVAQRQQQGRLGLRRSVKRARLIIPLKALRPHMGPQRHQFKQSGLGQFCRHFGWITGDRWLVDRRRSGSAWRPIDHAFVDTTLDTFSMDGRSYMVSSSVVQGSNADRGHRSCASAPCGQWPAGPPGATPSSTPSIRKQFRELLDHGVLGLDKDLDAQLRPAPVSVATTGRRPTNSGIRPYDQILGRRRAGPGWRSCSRLFTSAPKPIPLLRCGCG